MIRKALVRPPPELLRQAGPDGAEVERELRRLLPLKTKAEYEPDDIAPSVAAKAVERAHPAPDPPYRPGRLRSRHR